MPQIVRHLLRSQHLRLLYGANQMDMTRADNFVSIGAQVF